MGGGGLCCGGSISAPVWVRGVGPDPQVGEIPQGVSSPGGASDGGNGNQTLAGRDVGIPTHWSGAVNGGTGGDRGIYLPPPEHGRAIQCEPSYHGIVFGGRSEAGNAPIQVMVGAA